MLQDRLDHAAQRAQRSNGNAAVLFADLDQFKLINDTYGHRVGDELLIAVARRLQRLVRPGDTLARLSGDEFVFLCEDLNSPDDVKLLAQRIDEAFARPFVLTGCERSSRLVSASPSPAQGTTSPVIWSKRPTPPCTGQSAAARRATRSSTCGAPSRPTTVTTWKSTYGPPSPTTSSILPTSRSSRNGDGRATASRRCAGGMTLTVAQSRPRPSCRSPSKRTC